MNAQTTTWCRGCCEPVMISGKVPFDTLSLPGALIVCIADIHKETTISQATAEKRRTNITLNATNLAAARELGLNVSVISDAALAEAVRAARWSSGHEAPLMAQFQVYRLAGS